MALSNLIVILIVLTCSISLSHAEDGLVCSLCIDGVTAVEQSLESNATQQQIIDDLDKVCDKLPQPARNNCLAQVEQLKPKLNETDESIFAKYSIFAICSMFSACQIDCCGTPYLPEQIHLSITHDPSEMVVMWTTLRVTPHPIVFYGIDPNNLNMNVSGNTSTYTGGGWVGQIHTGKMVKLQPDTVYYYRVGDATVAPGYWLRPTWSQPALYFRTRKVPSASMATTVAIVGDAGGDDASMLTYFQLTRLVMDHKIDFLIHNGDIGYSDGYEPLMDTFLRMAESVSAFVPYMYGVGNHEGFYDFSPYKHRFYVPYKESNSTDPLYYSFDYGLVHYAHINSEGFMGLYAQVVTPESAMYKWLENDLAKVDRHKTPWVIVHLHRPLYCLQDTKDCNFEAQVLRKGLEELFVKYHVDIVGQAHRHSYQTTWPVYNMTKMGNDYVNPKYPIYVTNGAAGNKEHLDGNQSQLPVWGRSYVSRYGFGIMSVPDANHLTYQFISADNATVLDEWTIERK